MNQFRIFFQLFLLIVFLAGIYVIIRTDTLFKQQIIHHEQNINILKPTEGFTPEAVDNSCPNLLIQNGNKIVLHNTNAPVVEGTNPILFQNLDGYIDYLEKQRASGKICPVLFLQKETDTQGKDVYKTRPNPFDIRGEITNPPPSDTISYGGNVTIGVPIAPGFFNSGLSPYTTISVPMTQNTTTNNQDPGSVINPIKQLDASREDAPYNQGSYSGFDPTGLYIGRYTDIDKVHDSTADTKLSDNPMDANWGGVLYTESQIQSGKYDENNIYKPLLYNPKIMFDVTAQNPFPPPKDVLE